MIKYSSTTAFNREFKKMTKKYPSLPDDLSTLKKAVIELYHLMGVNSLSTFPIEGLCSKEKHYLSMKVKKFACRSLKGKGANTGLRLIYVFEPATQSVTFLEIYCKADKANEDKERIKKFIKYLENQHYDK